MFQHLRMCLCECVWVRGCLRFVCSSSWFMAVHYQRAAGVFPDAWIFQSPLRFTVSECHHLATIPSSFCFLHHIIAVSLLCFLTLCALNVTNLHLLATKQGTEVYTADHNNHLSQIKFHFEELSDLVTSPLFLECFNLESTGKTRFPLGGWAEVHFPHPAPFLFFFFWTTAGLCLSPCHSCAQQRSNLGDNDTTHSD